jgi:hypothetical protein
VTDDDVQVTFVDDAAATGLEPIKGTDVGSSTPLASAAVAHGQRDQPPTTPSLEFCRYVDRPLNIHHLPRTCHF